VTCSSTPESPAAPETPIDTIDSNVALTESLTVLQVAIRDNQAQVSADPLPRVRISPVHLQQLFQNLISNAIKYRSTETAAHPFVRIPHQF